MSTETDEHTFAGLPVKGDISRYTEPTFVPPRTEEEFKAALDVVFATGLVAAVTWTQSTPSWNDGEPCVFSVGEVGILIRDDVSDELKASLEEIGHDDELTDWNPETEEYGDDIPVYTSISFDSKGPGAPIRAALAALNGDYIRSENDLANKVIGIESGAYDQVLLRHFGDPARVIARPDGFVIESYDPN